MAEKHLTVSMARFPGELSVAVNYLFPELSDSGERGTDSSLQQMLALEPEPQNPEDTLGSDVTRGENHRGDQREDHREDHRS